MNPNHTPPKRAYFAMSAPTSHTAEDLVVLSAFDTHKKLLKANKKAKHALSEAESAAGAANES